VFTIKVVICKPRSEVKESYAAMTRGSRVGECVVWCESARNAALSDDRYHVGVLQGGRVEEDVYWSSQSK
jgi:hypothetical protein